MIIDNRVIIAIRRLSKYVEYIGFTNIFRIKKTTIDNLELFAVLLY